MLPHTLIWLHANILAARRTLFFIYLRRYFFLQPALTLALSVTAKPSLNFSQAILCTFWNSFVIAEKPTKSFVPEVLGPVPVVVRVRGIA